MKFSDARTIVFLFLIQMYPIHNPFQCLLRFYFMILSNNFSPLIGKLFAVWALIFYPFITPSVTKNVTATDLSERKN